MLKTSISLYSFELSFPSNVPELVSLITSFEVYPVNNFQNNHCTPLSRNIVCCSNYATGMYRTKVTVRSKLVRENHTMCGNLKKVKSRNDAFLSNFARKIYYVYPLR